jgi:hypothetical protein
MLPTEGLVELLRGRLKSYDASSGRRSASITIYFLKGFSPPRTPTPMLLYLPNAVPLR